MFKKFAISLFEDIKNEVVIKSLSEDNENNRDFYKKVCDKIDVVLEKLKKD